MTPTHRHLLRALALCGGVAAAAAAGVQEAGAQERDRQCQVQFEPRSPADSSPTVLEQQNSGRYNAFQGGGVRYRCQGDDVTIEADSAAFYGDLNLLYMIGSVRYREPRAEMDADRLTYYRNEEWVVVEGNVFARMEDGSTMRGPTAEYFRAVPGVRVTQRLVATGRPVLELAQRDSAGVEQPPVTVVADRINAEGDSLVYAAGQVNITRPDVLARGDSAALDEGRGFARLMRSPEIQGRGERQFTLVGETIDLYSRERELERVLSMGRASVVSEDMTVSADTLDLRVERGELERAYAWGAGRARAVSPGREMAADSLDVHLPAQRLQTVYAVGAARLESDPDSASITSTVRDWLAGDTVITHFDTARVEGDTASRPRITELVARGGARSFQQIGPDSGLTDRPSIHYVAGRDITVTFDEGKPGRVVVTAPDSGQTVGVYLDATGATAERGGRTSPQARPVPADTTERPVPIPTTVPPTLPPGGPRDE